MKTANLECQFSVYYMANRKSTCGWPYIAVNDKQNLFIFMNERRMILTSCDPECKTWLENDYKKTSYRFLFVLQFFTKLITDHFDGSIVIIDVEWERLSGIIKNIKVLMVSNADNQEYQIKKYSPALFKKLKKELYRIIMSNPLLVSFN